VENRPLMSFIMVFKKMGFSRSTGVSLQPID